MIQRTQVMPLVAVLILVVAGFGGGNLPAWVQASIAALGVLIVLFSQPANILGTSWHDPARWFMVFLVAAGMSMLWSQNLYASVHTWVYIFFGYLLFVSGRQLSAAQRAGVMTCCTVIVALHAGWALFDQVQQQLPRAQGLLQNANSLGALLGLTLPVAIGVAMRITKRLRWLLWVAAVIIAIALARSFSLTAFFGLVVAGLAIAPFALRRARPQRVVGITAGVIVGILLVTIGIRSVQLGSIQKGYRLDQVITAEHFDSSFGQRARFALSALLMFQDYPVTGIGLSAFQLVYPRYALTLHEQPQFAHNAFLEVFAEAGVVAGVLFVITMYTLVRLAVVRARQGETPWYMVVALGSGIVAAAVDFGWHFVLVWLGFWLVAGMATHASTEPTERHSRIPWVALLAVSVFLCAVSLTKLVADQSFVRAEAALADGKAAEAIPNFERALTLDPQPRMGGRLAVALWLEAQGDPDTLRRAQAVLEQNLRWSSADYFTYHILGRVHASAGQSAAAESAFRTALDQSRNFHPEIAWEYVNWLMKEGRQTEALAVVESVLYAYADDVWSANPNLSVILEAVRTQQKQLRQTRHE